MCRIDDGDPVTPSRSPISLGAGLIHLKGSLQRHCYTNPMSGAIEVVAIARRMISLYGDDALLIAQGRVRRDRGDGDHDGAASWARVAQIILALRTSSPESKKLLS